MCSQGSKPRYERTMPAQNQGATSQTSAVTWDSDEEEKAHRNLLTSKYSFNFYNFSVYSPIFNVLYFNDLLAV